jgi:hypothetical protein
LATFGIHVEHDAELVGFEPNENGVTATLTLSSSAGSAPDADADIGRGPESMTLRRKRNQLTGYWRGRHAVDPYRFRNVARVWNQIVLDETTKVPLVLVSRVGVQPRRAKLHQIGSQGDSLDCDQSEQMAHRHECFTSADYHKDVVAFNRAKVRLDGFSKHPCQVGFLHESHLGHHSLVFRTIPTLKPGAAPIQERRMDFRDPQLRVTIIRCSIATVSAQNLYEFPRADHAQSALI